MSYHKTTLAFLERTVLGHGAWSFSCAIRFCLLIFKEIFVLIVASKDRWFSDARSLYTLKKITEDSKEPLSS